MAIKFAFIFVQLGLVSAISPECQSSHAECLADLVEEPSAGDISNLLLQTKLEKSHGSINHTKEDPEEETDNTSATLTVATDLGPLADLVMAMPLVLQNLTNYSGLISVKRDPAAHALEEQGISHAWGNKEADEDLLFEMVEGFWTVLHETIHEDAREYCPFNDVSIIPRCVNMALCLVQANITSIPDVDNNELYSLYEEIAFRFEEVSWNLIHDSLQSESTTEIPDEFIVPMDYTCDGTFNWMFDEEEENRTKEDIYLDEGGLDEHGNLVQVKAQRSLQKAKRAAAYRTSSALVEASKITHEVLDAHFSNSSMQATLEALHKAWEAPCKFLGCNHKNYYDMYGASHSHSLTLLDVGASLTHMRVHIRSRIHLENRMQRFLGGLGEHGAHFMQKMYTDEGTTTETQMQAYFRRCRNTFMKFVTKYAKAQGVKGHWLDLLNRDRMRAYFEEQGQLEEFTALWQAHYGTNTHADHHDDHDDHDAQALVEVDDHDVELVDDDHDAEALVEVDETELDEELTQGSRRRRNRRRRWIRRRRRRRIGGAIVGAISSAANAVADVATSIASSVANAVNTAIQFLADVFACFGMAKTMVATGYCKKFPFAPPPGVQTGVGVSLTASTGSAVYDIMTGQFTGAVIGVAVKIGVVFGGVPYTPETGGVRTGVGISGGVTCSQTGCNVGISVGPVLSGLVPTTGEKCFLGPKVMTPAGPFACMIGAGATVSTICCNFNLITGAESCR